MKQRASSERTPDYKQKLILRTIQKTMRTFLFLMAFLCSALSVSADDVPRYATNSVLSTGTWVKIRVEKEGVHQLTASSLRSMGFSTPERVKLYGLNMEVLPESGLENLADDLEEIPLYRTGDKLLFYARGTTRWTLSQCQVGSSASSSSVSFQHFNNPYSTAKYYFLTEGDSPKEFATYSYEMGNGASTTTVFPEHSIVEADGFSYLNSGRVFFEDYDFANGSSKTYTLDLPGISSVAPATIDVRFCAAGNASSSLTVAMNDENLGTISFSKLGNYEYGKLGSGSYQWSGTEEQNRLKLTHNRASGINGHLDYIRASYLRNLALSGNELLFRPFKDGDLLFQLSGATENTVVWRVTSGVEIEGVNCSLSGSTLTIPFTSESTAQVGWKNEELVALNPNASFPSPSVVGKIENQDLHALGNIDLVIVIPTSGKLRTQAQRLADAHLTYDSISSVVVSADKIYNEFSAGTPDATAIRRFMKMLYDNASSAVNRPKNLLLFGDGVWDNRMVTPTLRRLSPDDYLLCYESDNSLSHTDSYVMEEYYTLVDDNAPADLLTAQPRIGVGRIPVLSASEAKGVVDKLIHYMSNQSVGAWKNTICFLNDDGNNNIHMKDGEAVIGQIESQNTDYLIRRIYLDTYQRISTATGFRYPGVVDDLNKAMRDGVLVMNYTGHGAPTLMTHEQVVFMKDFLNWNSPNLPLWVTAACDIAPFDMNIDNIGEAAILNPSGASMGIVATARTVYSSPNRQLNMRFMKYLIANNSLGQQNTLGEALALAKSEMVRVGSPNAVNRVHFCLLGDPAIKLATPKYKVVVDEINGKSVDGTDVTEVGTGGIVSVSGHIENTSGLTDDTFSGLIHSTILDNVENVVCQNNPYGAENGNEDEEPYTFEARMRTLYSLTDSVKAGKFTFKFPIPLDNNYSGKSGLISLYAVNDDKSIEAQGHNEQFIISPTIETDMSDKEGPTISPVFLNTDNFQNGDVVNETPLLMARLSDPSGINMTGSGIGHDIVAMIDNNESTTYSLNGYFTPTAGDFCSGTVAFSIPELTDGPHKLELRAFDSFNNPSTAVIDFYVNNGEKPTIFSLSVNSPVSDEAVFTIENDRPQTNLSVQLRVYDISGRQVYETSQTNFTSSSSYTFTWDTNGTDSHLVPGIYIVKAAISTSDGPQATKATKFIVTRHK